jgi:hypothetical protein
VPRLGQSGRETGVAERERKGDMTQGHMDRSRGGVASHGMLYHCTSIVFFSRPESGVICMTDDGFVRVVGDKGKGTKEKRRRKKFVIGEKLIRIIFDQ